jgi:uncharacterized membrane protein
MATTLATREMRKISKLTKGEISPKFLRQNAYKRKFHYMKKICDIGEGIAITGLCLSLVATAFVLMFWGFTHMMCYPAPMYYAIIGDYGKTGIIILFVSLIVIILCFAYQLKVGKVRDFIAESMEQHSDIISAEEIVTIIK